jgi:hypothetical protein
MHQGRDVCIGVGLGEFWMDDAVANLTLPSS